ncbi:hypothetical protein [Pseudomonas putida]|uniref:Uncharacterized protein n=1 Tax=Pseudomonas putida TaxID=303 RepID=A0A6I6XLV7_PSEPU|nr:hypothetical protein [Pseudomonas putida]QHG66648.1 hypothetical protein C2H86_20525 [Pseudomonas putida]
MSSTQYFQIFFDHPDERRTVPDASASYELILSEVIGGRGAAEGRSVMHPVITIEQNGELSLPQTFCFMIDEEKLKAGNSYNVCLRYKVTTESNQGERLEWNETFVAQGNTRIAPQAYRGHGPCMGRTGLCLSW